MSTARQVINQLKKAGVDYNKRTRAPVTTWAPTNEFTAAELAAMRGLELSPGLRHLLSFAELLRDDFDRATARQKLAEATAAELKSLMAQKLAEDAARPTARRAGGVADDVSDATSVCSTASTTTARARRRPVAAADRRRVWVAHAGNEPAAPCSYCKIDVTEATFDVSHKISVANGGTNAVANLMVLCRTCNTSMGAQNWEDFMRERGLSTGAE